MVHLVLVRRLARFSEAMSTLADALIPAITYISTASGDDTRAAADVRLLESLTAMLRHCSASQRDALRAVLGRARRHAMALSSTHSVVLDNSALLRGTYSTPKLA